MVTILTSNIGDVIPDCRECEPEFTSAYEAIAGASLINVVFLADKFGSTNVIPFVKNGRRRKNIRGVNLPCGGSISVRLSKDQTDTHLRAYCPGH
jgi:hypothetical protein